MPRILVTNDDGVHSPGLAALVAAMKPLGDVTVVAPATEMSAVSHALTITRPLRLERVRDGVFAVDGTPTDCVTLAYVKVLDAPPDLVVSGINLGYNLSVDITYSGTVAGAMEGTIFGVPSIAFSLCRTKAYDFTQATWAARVVAQRVLDTGLPPRTLLNVNIPQERVRGFRVTIAAGRTYRPEVLEGIDPRGRTYFWIKEGQSDVDPGPRSDYHAVREGYVSVTPLRPDLTHHAEVESALALALPETLADSAQLV